MSSAPRRQPASQTSGPPPQLRVIQPDDALSPSLDAAGATDWRACELKFFVSPEVAAVVQAWAGQNLSADPHADPAQGGTYLTTTLYLDTPRWDVFRRSLGFRRRKYRIRRYGDAAQVHLERKSRRQDWVRKRRCEVPQAELARLAAASRPSDWAGDWFHEQTARRMLRPAGRITYRRAAFVGTAAGNPIRLTLDRQVRGALAADWCLDPVSTGEDLLAGGVICEFKFRDAMPPLFQQLQAELKLAAGSVSKYRRCIAAALPEIG
ncbi:MAG: polyphosphate polymerase domain-containing protein [Pirellulaceae bacterium]|nr:polyphosphate polymerase domain-containing protein [Pirellulaceae bacterium]